MKKLLVLIAAGILLSGCAAKLPSASPEVLSSLADSSTNPLTLYSTGGPSLSIMSVKSVAGSGLAAMMTKSQDLPTGAEITRAYNVPDASDKLREKFVDDLKSYGVTNVATDPAAYHEAKEGTAAAPLPGQGYSLDVRVTGFQANYLPFNWQTYAVIVQGEGKLYDNLDGEMVWEGRCFVNGYNDKRMKLDVLEFEKDEAAKLKEILDVGTAECSKNLTAALFDK